MEGVLSRREERRIRSLIACSDVATERAGVLPARSFSSNILSSRTTDAKNPLYNSWAGRDNAAQAVPGLQEDCSGKGL